MCMTCHEVQAKGYRESPHARTWDVRAPAADRGCETCHGAGGAHVGDPGAKGLLRNFKKMAPRDASKACMTCHNRQEHVNWQGGTHDVRNVTCVSCHSVHTPKSDKAHLKEATVVATCATCHRDKAAKMLRSSHMPIREGKMDCSSCHNQHGSTNVAMLKTGNTVTEFCVSCHSEKRGPFLWDHPPVRENCASCHDPHGSNNDRMLVAKAPMLCQRCHVSEATRHPSAPYDGKALLAGNNRLVNRGCVNCHSNIHGSNHPSGQFFHR
jgi:DmsE family decaheme c-type cytochrome